MRTRMLVLDRDGVLIRDTGRVWRPEDIEYLPGAIEALSKLPASWLVVFCSNQAAVGQGNMTEKDLVDIDRTVKHDLFKAGIKINKSYYCMHRPEDKCECRKPKPYMILAALRDFNIRPADTWGVGDKDSDMAAYRAAGIHAVRVLDPNSPMSYDMTDEGDEFEVLGSLAEAIDKILERLYWQDLNTKAAEYNKARKENRL